MDRSLDAIIAERAKPTGKGAGGRGGAQGEIKGRGGNGGRGGRGGRGGGGAPGASGPIRRNAGALAARVQKRSAGILARPEKVNPLEGARWGHDLNPEAAAKQARLQAPTTAGTKLMIVNLDPEISEEELKELFETGIGKVRSVVITANAAGTQTNGEIVYQRHEDALKAIEEFHGREINGRVIRVLVLSSAESRAAAKELGGGVAGASTASGGPVRGRGAVTAGHLYADGEVSGGGSPVPRFPTAEGSASPRFPTFAGGDGSPKLVHARAPIRIVGTRGRGGSRGGRGGAAAGTLRLPTASGAPLVRKSSPAKAPSGHPPAPAVVKKTAADLDMELEAAGYHA